MKVTKIFHFDAGHRLSNYSGKCKRLHGHTYMVEITVSNDYLNEAEMVIDFGDLKDLFNQLVDNKFDHRMILKSNDPINIAIGNALPKDDESICWVSYNPTAENIAKDIYFIFMNALLGREIKLESVRVYETPTSYAEVSSDMKI
jgi:6-pyruvoyltetrahydropterin/6-carboxytetrahydropterin synthase